MLTSSRDEGRNLHSPNVFINKGSIQPQGTGRCVWDMDSFGGNFLKRGSTEKYQYHVHKVAEGRCRSQQLLIKKILLQPACRSLITIFFKTITIFKGSSTFERYIFTSRTEMSRWIEERRTE